jgi:hypothetical protein
MHHLIVRRVAFLFVVLLIVAAILFGLLMS